MKFFPIIGCMAILTLTACQQDSDIKNNEISQSVAEDSSATLVTTPINQQKYPKKIDFPLFIQGIPSLLHPILPAIPVPDDGREKLSSIKSDKINSEYGYLYQNQPYSFQANIYNLVFEHIKTGETQRLFQHDNFLIKRIFYPFIANDKDIISQKETNNNQQLLNTPKQMFSHFIYHVQEKPFQEINDSNDLSIQLSLYMSDDMGKNLIKLHPNTEFVQSIRWIPEVSRYYFVTQSDSNANGKIDENDRFYNYVIDFKQKNPKASLYQFKK